MSKLTPLESARKAGFDAGLTEAIALVRETFDVTPGDTVAVHHATLKALMTRLHTSWSADVPKDP